MSRKFLILITLLIFTVSCSGCEKNNSVETETMQEYQVFIGKSFNIIITDDETVDAEHLKKVMNGEIKKDVPYFDMWNGEALVNLIEYMENNEYEIIPGKYEINQGWGFKDGLCIVGNETREVFKFNKKRSKILWK